MASKDKGIIIVFWFVSQIKNTSSAIQGPIVIEESERQLHNQTSGNNRIRVKIGSAISNLIVESQLEPLFQLILGKDRKIYRRKYVCSCYDSKNIRSWIEYSWNNNGRKCFVWMAIC